MAKLKKKLVFAPWRTSKERPPVKPSVSAPASATSPGEALPKRNPKTPQILRGMRDILPVEQAWWNYLKDTCARLARDYGFERIDLPILEATQLFERGVGKATDIVEKEMFSFLDRSEDSLTLRPEATAGMARAYIEHGFVNQPQPVKLYTEGAMFRYQRPQYGRQREFHQWDYEIIGDNHPIVDATFLIMAFNLYTGLNVPVTLQVNSIGDAACRPTYIKALLEYYRKHRAKLCESCLVRLSKSPLRLFDCKEEQCQPLKAGAPQFVDHLCENCRDHFTKFLEYLDELDIPYVLNAQLVRGLDYYTRTVFEIWSQDDEQGRVSLGGGGRYDGLIELLGGRPTPACGLALGLETIILKMRELNVPLPEVFRPDVFIAQLGEPAKRKALRLYEDLRRQHVVVAGTFSKGGLKGQMDMADKLGVRFAIILGQKETMDGTVIIRDMEAGIQEIYDFKKVLPEILKKLETKPIVRQEAVVTEPLLAETPMVE